MIKGVSPFFLFQVLGFHFTTGTDTAPQFLSFEAKLFRHLPLTLAAIYIVILISIVIAGSVRAVFKWLSKVITRLRLLVLLRAVIGFKISSQLFSQREAKSKPIITHTRDLSRALSKLQVIAKNSDSFIALFAPVMWSDYLRICFSIVIWKTL